MRIDDFSLAFKCSGCPSWGTAIVVQDVNKTHLIKTDIASNILYGMMRKSVTINTHNFSLPIGKGSKLYYGDTGFDEAKSEPMLVSVFEKVYIDNIKINAPFIMCIVKDRAEDHKGRLQIKYTPKLKYGKISNEDFFKEARRTLNIDDVTPWVIYDIEVREQEELHFKALIDENEIILKERLKELPDIDYVVKKQSDRYMKPVLLDLIEIPQTPFSIKTIIQYIKETGLLYTEKLIKRFAFSLMAKRFLILSGLAGSGKTQLALAFANALIADKKQLCVVSVGADWTNREPLLGFPNALKDDEYVRPESGVLDLLIEANKEENKEKPYFLILDEMNMSYVERYFADFLSVMESGEGISLWKGSDDSDVPSTISLPNNLFIIGTINVDETTYMFSPKVLDRANVIEFKISSDEMENFLNEMKNVDRCSINGKAAGMGANFVNLANVKELDKDDEAVNTLQNFFKELKKVNAEFGYRTATEIFRYIAQAKKNDDTEDKLTSYDILDAAIIQKLLPKLHGSRKKLEPVLAQLWKLCFTEEVHITRENVDKAIYKESADKILRMYEAANANGFTSFAEA